MNQLLEIFSNACGLIGSLLIFRFGIPSQVDTGGKIQLLAEQEDEEEKLKIAQYKRLGSCGIGLIAISFLLPMVSDLYHIPIFKYLIYQLLKYCSG